MQDDRKLGDRGRGNPSMRDDDRGTPGRRAGQDPDQRGGAMPPQDDRRATQRAQRRIHDEPGNDPATGSVESPVAPGEAQAGDLGEQAQQLGGPVDVSPVRGSNRKERPAS
jgi:hypothetical protein